MLEGSGPFVLHDLQRQEEQELAGQRMNGMSHNSEPFFFFSFKSILLTDRTDLEQQNCTPVYLDCMGSSSRLSQGQTSLS